jgi:hypothetical protein
MKKQQTLITLDYIKQLYEKYKIELHELQSYLKEAKQKVYLSPMFDDIEAEITYMRLRELKPKNIYEFSPCHGYSTIIMAFAVMKNNNGAKIKTYDIEDFCTSNFNALGLNSIIDVTIGDVQLKYNEFQDVDYLFIDSDHSKEFATFYTQNLLNDLYKENYIPGSCHDIFHYSSPSEEGEVIIDFLNSKNISWYTPHTDQNEINLLRETFNLGEVHHYKANSVLLF